MHLSQEERLVLTVTTPTRDLDSPDYLFSLIKPCDYQVIPATPSSLVYDTDAILLKVLASKQHRDILLDLALPYRYKPPGQPTSTYFGRYLIFNQSLLAVRLASAPSSSSTATYPKRIKQWPAGQRSYHQVPACIRKFYKHEQIDGSELVLVGDFFIRFRGVQIALLFES
jgi:hypothetical protein